MESSGALEKGSLIFDASFESGNLGEVRVVSPIEYDIVIAPDSNNDRYRVWFYFSVRNVKAPQRAIFHIVNPSKTKSLYRDGMSPVVRSTSRPMWQRIPSKHTFYYHCPRNNFNYVMSFMFAFDRDDDVYYF
eukprot:GILI01074865.1.p1 GENE.GILI01074865.1~~GILI01074865.1.p1  ORF type:complete len:132 (-),score=11.45 GILI01074865.1:15-410(-)